MVRHKKTIKQDGSGDKRAFFLNDISKPPAPHAALGKKCASNDFRSQRRFRASTLAALDELEKSGLGGSGQGKKGKKKRLKEEKARHIAFALEYHSHFQIVTGQV